MKIKLLFLVLILIWSCNQNKKDKTVEIPIKEVSPSFRRTEEPEINKLYNKYINENNTKEYNNLSVEAIIAGQNQELLFYSLRMANKNNCPEAFYYTYYALNISGDGVSIKDTDEKTWNLALYYLIKSHELGYKDAIYDINRIFGTDSEVPKSNYYLLKYAKG